MKLFKNKNKLSEINIQYILLEKQNFQKNILSFNRTYVPLHYIEAIHDWDV